MLNVLVLQASRVVIKDGNTDLVNLGFGIFNKHCK